MRIIICCVSLCLSACVPHFVEKQRTYNSTVDGYWENRQPPTTIQPPTSATASTAIAQPIAPAPLYYDERYMPLPSGDNDADYYPLYDYSRDGQAVTPNTQGVYEPFATDEATPYDYTKDPVDNDANYYPLLYMDY